MARHVSTYKRCDLEWHQKEHPVRRMEYPVHHKYPIMYVILGVIPIKPFVMHIEVLKKAVK